MHRSIFFVDGENLTFRYQDMLANGHIPANDVIHEKDTFAWCEQVLARMSVQPIRINYYTSAVGGQDVLDALADKIAKQRVPTQGTGLGYVELTPHVRKKDSQGRKSRIVDIALTKDIMRAALATDIELIVLITGDGDFVQVVEDITRNTAKQIFVGALSSGLSPGLKRVADGFRYLDAAFFSDPKFL